MISVNTSIRLIPTEKISIINQSLPAANSNLLPSDITGSYGTPSDFNIYICVSVAGTLSIRRTVTSTSTTVTEILNSNNVLIAGSLYAFTVPIRTGDSINLRFSVTGGTINSLRIDEISGG
jgi:hypothetical protein